MTFNASAIFRSYITDSITRVAAQDFDTNVIKAALYNNTGTPDKDATSALSAYNVGQWVTANEVFQAGQYAQGGVTLASKTVTNPASGIAMADAADTSSGSAATLSAVFGALVYDSTVTTPVASQAFCYNYFGGSNSVTAGTFTIVWNANGLFRFTV
jgi:hypothetical protein